MAEKTGKSTGSAESNTANEFEQRKNEALAILLEESVRFVKTDGDVNDLLKELLAAIVEQAKKNPGALFSSRGDIDELVSALKARGEGGTGVSGGDIVGEGILDDIANFILKLGDIFNKEKDFFLQIIKLIICGC